MPGLIARRATRSADCSDSAGCERGTRMMRCRSSAVSSSTASNAPWLRRVCARAARTSRPGTAAVANAAKVRGGLAMAHSLSRHLRLRATATRSGRHRIEPRRVHCDRSRAVGAAVLPCRHRSRRSRARRPDVRRSVRRRSVVAGTRGAGAPGAARRARRGVGARTRVAASGRPARIGAALLSRTRRRHAGRAAHLRRRLGRSHRARSRPLAGAARRSPRAGREPHRASRSRRSPSRTGMPVTPTVRAAARRPSRCRPGGRGGANVRATSSSRAPTLRSSCSSPTTTTGCCSARTRSGSRAGSRCWPGSSSRASRSSPR